MTFRVIFVSFEKEIRNITGRTVFPFLGGKRAELITNISREIRFKYNYITTAKRQQNTKVKLTLIKIMAVILTRILMCYMLLVTLKDFF